MNFRIVKLPAAKMDFLAVAACLIVARVVVVLVVGKHSLLTVAALLLGVFVAYFLCHRSRIAWLVASLGAGATVAAFFTEGRPIWLVLPSVAVLACLLAPGSISAVWGGRSRRTSLTQRVSSAQEQLVDSEYAGLTWLGRALGSIAHAADALLIAVGGLKRLLWMMFFALLVIAPAVGLLYNVHNGSGRNSVPLSVLWDAVWIIYNVLRVCFVALLVVAAHSHFTRRRESSNRVQSTR